MKRSDEGETESNVTLQPTPSESTITTTTIITPSSPTEQQPPSSTPTTTFTPLNYNPKVHSAVLWLVFTTEFFAFSLTSLLVPFFRNYAEIHFPTASKGEIFDVFSINPLVALLFTPITGYLCNRFGRKTIYFLGLILLATGCSVFGYAANIIQIFFGGVIMGLGSTCLGISGLALILQVSNNLERDAGWEEIICGLGYFLGPAVGGVLYEQFGFSSLYLTYTIIFGLEIIFFPLVAYHVPNSITDEKKKPKGQQRDNTNGKANEKKIRIGMDEQDTDTDIDVDEEEEEKDEKRYYRGSKDNKNDDDNHEENLLTTPLLTKHFSQKPNDDDDDDDDDKNTNNNKKTLKEKDVEEKLSLKSLLDRTVVFTAPVIGLAYFSLAFIDPIASKHFEQSLGLGEQGVGFMCMIPSGAYILTSSICFEIIKVLGHKMTMVYGLFMIGMGYFLMGPFPPLITFFTKVGLNFQGNPEHDPVWLTWTFQVLGFTLFGVGISFMYIPAIPMMKAVLMAKLKSKLKRRREIEEQKQNMSKLESMESGEKIGINIDTVIDSTNTCIINDNPNTTVTTMTTKKNIKEEEKEDIEKENEKEENLMSAKEVAFIDDSLSSIFFFFVNFGQFIGPLLCGPAINSVPQVDEMGCIDTGEEEKDCKSGYPWTASIAAFVMFFISLIFYFCVPSLQKTLLDLSNASTKIKVEKGKGEGWYESFGDDGKKKEEKKQNIITKKDYMLLVDDPPSKGDLSTEAERERGTFLPNPLSFLEKIKAKNEEEQHFKNSSSTPLGSPHFHTPSSSSPRRGSSPFLQSSYYVTRTLSTSTPPREEKVKGGEREQRSNSYDMTLHQNHYSIPHTLNIPESLGTFGNFSKGKSSPFQYHDNPVVVQTECQHSAILQHGQETKKKEG